MRITDFDIYRDILKARSGLSITQDKAYLLDSRLTPVAKKWGYASLEGLTMALRGVPDEEVIKDIVEAMTTNETFFFRDQKPFDLFANTVLPYLAKHRKKKSTVRIWCAASSTGQEPYSLAILLKEHAALIENLNVEIIATDIADKVLNTAREGFFSQFEVQRGMPVQLLLKYFTTEGDGWRLNEDLRSMVKFEKFNLLDDMASKGQFDVVFCRNVLIYFDEATKSDILNRISNQMAPDSFLFLGGAETIIGLTESFKPLAERRGLYVLQDSAHDLDSMTA